MAFIPKLCTKFKHSSLIGSASRNTQISAFLHNYKCVKNYGEIINDLEDVEGFWTKTWRTWVILGLIFVPHIWFLTLGQNFCTLKWLEGCQELLIFDVVLGGCWGFLAGDLENNFNLDISYLVNIWSQTFLSNSNVLAQFKVCQEPTINIGDLVYSEV